MSTLTTTPQDLHNFDPLREPEWRFERVLKLVEHEPRPLRCRASDDNYVRTMRDFLLAFNPRNHVTRPQLYPLYPGPYHALMIRDASNPDVRLFIECRLLARQSDDEIAQRVATTPEAIEWYEKMFFNVRDRFANTDGIAQKILGPARLRNLSNFELPLKLFAYFGGPQLLDFVLTGFKNNEHLQNSEEIDEFLGDFIASNVRRRAAMAVQMFNVNKYNVMQLFDLVRQIHADQKAAQDPTAMAAALATNVRSFISGIEYTVGTNVESGSQSQKISDYDESAAELRDDELMDVASGARDPKEVKALVFPPVPAKARGTKNSKA